MKTKLKLLFVLPRKYPSKDAATSHIALFIKGLEALGHTVKVACSPSGLMSKAEDSFATRLVAYLLRPTMAARAGNKLCDDFEPDAIVSYGQSFHSLWPILRLAKRRKKPILVITTEIWTFSPDIALMSLDNFLYRKLIQPSLDGVLAISQEILADANRSGSRGFYLPALTGHSDSSLIIPMADGCFNLVYVGSLFRRDLPFTLLDGFARFHSLHPHSRLIVVGNITSTKHGRKFAKVVASSPVLARCIEIVGWVSDEQLRSIMSSASAFVILRQDDTISRACFPFRLAGFMMTAKPVIISAVGEPARLYANRVSAFHVPPGQDADAFCKVLLQVADDKELALSVGAAGRLACLSVQDNIKCSAEAAQFIAQIINR